MDLVENSHCPPRSNGRRGAVVVRWPRLGWSRTRCLRPREIACASCALASSAAGNISPTIAVWADAGLGRLLDALHPWCGRLTAALCEANEPLPLLDHRLAIDARRRVSPARSAQHRPWLRKDRVLPAGNSRGRTAVGCRHRPTSLRGNAWRCSAHGGRGSIKFVPTFGHSRDDLPGLPAGSGRRRYWWAD